MITDRNKLNFVTIPWLLWLIGLIFLVCNCSGSDSNSNSNSNSNTLLIHAHEATQQHQQQKQQQQQQKHEQQQHQQQQQQQHEKEQHHYQPQKPLQQQQQLQQQLQQVQQQHQQTTFALAHKQVQQSTLQQQVESNGPLSSQQDVTVRNFSPRMDYNNHEWRPVGRGDPLKNDPTFDYSPPTLDRVRYWADPDKDKEKLDEATSALVDAKLKKANPGKNEIMVLGVTGDRLRGSPKLHHTTTHSPGIMKNAKGETPLLQPKYTSIRRSYYAHQLPTHLMPPPMQPMMPMSQTQQQQQLMHQQMVMQHMVKPVHSEYRHNMPGGGSMIAQSYVSSPAMNGHTKPQLMSMSTHQPWMHTASSMGTSMPSQHIRPAAVGQHYHHPSAYDAHHQESMNYLTYTRPSTMMSSTPAVMGVNQDYYSPNSIRGSVSVQKPVTSSRKPWLHDLLKKEFIKVQKPTVSPNSYYSESTRKPQVETNSHYAYQTEVSKPLRIETNYHNSYNTERPKPTPMETNYHGAFHMNMDTHYHNSYHTDEPRPLKMENHFANSYHTDATKPPQMESHFEPMITPPRGISTTYAPVTFVTPPTTLATSTKAAVYITSSTSTTTAAPTRSTTTLSPTRLLIPNTSNLAYRPTVTPMKMTTDSLFSHYNQPEKPLKGPMYLIIEGHSKVKTYGKDELDPHRPKIVPVISKREPVVRVADPNEKRGTPETFQVKHLHTKTTTAMENATVKPTTKPNPSSTTTTKKPIAATTTASTTKKAISNATKPTKPITTNKPPVSTTKGDRPGMATTTNKPMTTNKTVPKLSVTTTTTTTTTAKPKTLNKESPKFPMKGEKMSPNNLNALDSGGKPTQGLPTQPPTGMQDLLSLLSSSFNTFLQNNEPSGPANSPMDLEQREGTTTTRLKPINMIAEPEIEARVSTKLQAIKAEDYEDNDDLLRTVTTEYLPRETRQIFDYDQLPESRISSDKKDSNYEELIHSMDEEDELAALGFDDEYEDDEDDEPFTSNPQQLIKRIDSLVSSTEDIGDLDGDEMDSFAAFGDDDLEALDLARQEKSLPKKA